MKTDDPKFTAHALGELEDLTPAERAEIEALIADDTHAAVEASETKKFATRLRAELHAEKSEPLTAEQHAEVLAATQKNLWVDFPKASLLSRRSLVLSAIAACLIVGLFVSMMYRAMERDRVAMQREQESGASSSLSAVEVSVPAAENSGVLADPKPSELVGPRPVVTMNSPTVDVVRTTSSPTAFKIVTAPAVPGINIGALRPAATPSPQIAGYLAGAPYGMKGRVGAGRAKAMSAVNRPLADPEVVGARRNFDTGIGNFDDYARPQSDPATTASFDSITDNPFLPVREHPLSTFSTDVDTASYAIVRRCLNQQQRPPKEAVRIEELLNYFTYDYPQPKGDAPFSATMEVAACPWTPTHRLVRIGLKGREIAKDKRPASNLVFLLDVSGSMQPANRLPLLKQSLGLLIDQLGAEDRVAIVVYAGNSGCVLDSTSDKAEMRLALSRLEAGGSTNGSAGIQLAYEIARKNFIKGGVNRVILGTDGDWNVGITNHDDLFDLIKQQAKSGVFLTVVGVGFGNLKDAMLVQLADKGNGNYAYLDTLLEAKKLLVDQLSGTLVTIAKDVKIQVEFNPSQVSGYRLIGYEKRLLAKEDFNDDKKDAGEIGAGHTVTALYEVVPEGKDLPEPATVDPLKYQPPTAKKPEATVEKSGASPEMLTLKLRYKAPDGDTSKLLEFPLTDTGAILEKSSRDFRFAAAVAGYGMLLRDSAHKGNATWNSVHELAVEGKGADTNGYRAEFISLIEKAHSLVR